MHHTAQRHCARTYGRSIQRNSVFDISMRCNLVKLEKVASLVSMAYTSPLNMSAYNANTTTTIAAHTPS